MKKTIFITLAMLIVFGAAVIFGADRVSTDWQQPQQDETNIEVKPVIDMVEEELENYPYAKSIQIEEITEDMVTQQEAAYVAGTMFEYFWEDLNMKGKEATVIWNMVLHDKDGGPLFAYYITYYDGVEGEVVPVTKQAFVDPLTGQLTYIRRDEENFHGVKAELIDETHRIEPPIDKNAVDMLLDRTVEYATKLGYPNCIEYAVTRDTMGMVVDKSNDAAIYVMTIKTKDNVILEFAYYDNAELNYPLNFFTNITKTANDCENLPQLSPIPQ
ncbi:MAG: hypothetical protein IKT63_02785 [Oscillospiraceae bacterium]|nr:hypothetical protein [Oscillospiraceae bacterium]